MTNGQTRTVWADHCAATTGVKERLGWSDPVDVSVGGRPHRGLDTRPESVRRNPWKMLRNLVRLSSHREPRLAVTRGGRGGGSSQRVHDTLKRVGQSVVLSRGADRLVPRGGPLPIKWLDPISINGLDLCRDALGLARTFSLAV
jgi:hypothetical protein